MKAERPSKRNVGPQATARAAPRVRYKADVRIGEAGERSFRIRAISSVRLDPATSEIVVPQAHAYEFMELVIHMVAEMDRHRK